MKVDSRMVKVEILTQETRVVWILLYSTIVETKVEQENNSTIPNYFLLSLSTFAYTTQSVAVMQARPFRPSILVRFYSKFNA